MTLVKLSLLASYLRFLTIPLYRHLNWGMITIVASWGIGRIPYSSQHGELLTSPSMVAFLVASLTVCRPLRAYWDTELAPEADCIDDQARTLAFTISNLVTDVMILVLPIPTFWKLKLPIRERLALTGLMSLGLLYGSYPTPPQDHLLTVYDKGHAPLQRSDYTTLTAYTT
jgi:hypothetical protein